MAGWQLPEEFMSEHSRPEYHQLVATTVARLNKDTGGARGAVVERARTGLTQVHSVHRLSLLKIVVAELERMALEDAIQKVEVECRTLAALSGAGARANF
jgi:PII-like signaling protein